MTAHQFWVTSCLRWSVMIHGLLLKNMDSTAQNFCFRKKDPPMDFWLTRTMIKRPYAWQCCSLKKQPPGLATKKRRKKCLGRFVAQDDEHIQTKIADKAPVSMQTVKDMRDQRSEILPPVFWRFSTQNLLKSPEISKDARAVYLRMAVPTVSFAGQRFVVFVLLCVVLVWQKWLTNCKIPRLTKAIYMY